VGDHKDIISCIGWVAAAFSIALGLAGLLNLEAIYTPKRIWWGEWACLAGLIVFILSRLVISRSNRRGREL
jgi:hypothetical protein